MKAVSKPEQRQDYWQRNIEAFGKVYANALSDEVFDSPGWLQAAYKKLVMPTEKRLMRQRYLHTINFINEFVKEGMTATDIGCGTGIFSIEMLNRGARVIAVDYTERAIELTRQNVSEQVPNLATNIEYVLMDVTKGPLPHSDIAIALGVTPYIEDISSFMNNVLVSTNRLYCLYLDPNHWANRIRSALPTLNVRRVICHSQSTIDELLAIHNFRLIERMPFATGFLDNAVSLG